jgi:hypothetical protein
MVAGTRPLSRHIYSACLVHVAFWLTVALTAFPAPAPGTPFHVEYQQAQCWYEPTRKSSMGWITFLETEVNWAFVRGLA